MSKKNGKTWADFWADSKALSWFIVVCAFFLIGYLVYDKWVVKIHKEGVEFLPAGNREPDVMPQKENHSTELPDKKGSTIQTRPSIPNKGTEQTGVEFHDSILKGSIVDGDGRPAVKAKVTCVNCIESNSPCFTDESGDFRMRYKMQYKQIEYPVKNIELEISYDNQKFSASQSISQSSLTIKLK